MAFSGGPEKMIYPLSRPLAENQKAIRRRKPVPPYSCGPVEEPEVVTAYLPKVVDGVVVVEDKGENTWRARNVPVPRNKKSHGVGYRREKRIETRMGEDYFLGWGLTVQGVDENDGWVRVEIPKVVSKIEPPLTEDEEWLMLVRCGGAGEVSDTKEQQKDRYKTTNEDSVEVFPSLAKHAFRRPDLLITCGMDYTIRSWDAKTFKSIQIFEGHFSFVNGVVPYRGSMLVSAGEDCCVRLWKIGKEPYGDLLMTYYISMFPVKCVAVVPGQRFCCGSMDQMFRVVSFLTGQILMRIDEHKTIGPDNNFMQGQGCGVPMTCVHIKQNLVATGGDDSTVRFWDIDKGRCLHYEKGHPGYGRDIGAAGTGYQLCETFAGVWKVINLQDGKHLCSCSYDRTLTVWDITDIEHIKVERNWRVGCNGVLNVGVVGPEEVASCCGDKDMKIWNWKTAELLQTVRTPNGSPHAVQYLDDNLIAMCGGDATIRILEWKDGIKDCIGKNGWNAHDFIITGCASVCFGDDDEGNFTEPIMYLTIEKEIGEKEAITAIKQHKFVLSEAVNYIQPDPIQL